MSTRESLGVAATGTALGLLTLWLPLNSIDGPIFTYIGKVILSGGVPYRDAWDVKAPGVFFFYAFAAWLGRPPLSVHFLETLWQCATALIAAQIAARMYARPRTGLLAGMIYLFLFYSQEPGSFGQADGLISLPLALAVWFAALAQERDAFYRWWFAGASLGLAALFRMPLGLLGIPFLWMAFRASPRSLGHRARRLAAMATGLAAPFMVCLWYFQEHGAARELLTTVLVIGPRYASVVWQHPDLGHLFTVLSDPLRIPLYAALSLASVCAAQRADRSDAQFAGFVLVISWAAVALVALVWQGVFFSYQFQGLFVPLAVLAAGALEPRLSPHSFRRAAASAVLVLAAAGAAVSLGSLALNSWDSAQAFGAGPPHGEMEQLAGRIRAQAAPADSICVWGRHAALYLEAERHPAAKFLNALVLTDPWKGLGLRPEFMRELESYPPAYFLVERAGAAGASLSNLPRMRQIDFEQEVRKFPQLEQFLSQNYSKESQTEAWAVYKKK